MEEFRLREILPFFSGRFLHSPVKLSFRHELRQADHRRPLECLLVGVVHPINACLMPQALQRRNDIFEVTVDLMAPLIAHLDGKSNAVQQLHRCLVFTIRLIGVAFSLHRHKIHGRDGHKRWLLRRQVKFLVFFLIIKGHRLHPPAIYSVSSVSQQPKFVKLIFIKTKKPFCACRRRAGINKKSVPTLRNGNALCKFNLMP